MNRWLAVISAVTAALAAAGCGDDGAQDGEALDGIWFYDEQEFLCSEAIALGDGYYEWKYICELEGGSVGMEVETGSYTVSSGEIAFSPEKSSCPQFGGEPYDLSYVLKGDNLTISSDQSVSVYERYEEMPSGGVSASIGCFDANGVFAPGALTAI